MKARAEFSRMQLKNADRVVCKACIVAAREEAERASQELLLCKGEDCGKEKPRSEFSKEQLKCPTSAVCKACMAKRLDTMYCAGCQRQQRHEFFSECKQHMPGNYRAKMKRRCNTCLEDHAAMLRAERLRDVASVQRLDHGGRADIE
jgi:hypothetical protein